MYANDEYVSQAQDKLQGSFFNYLISPDDKMITLQLRPDQFTYYSPHNMISWPLKAVASLWGVHSSHV